MPATTVLSTAEAAQLNTLRVELKQWEKSFSDANGGKKAGRHDIKQDPDIAAKYKTYGRLRALESSSSSHPKSESRHNKEVERTPSKSDQHDNARIKRKHDASLGLDGTADGQKQDHYTPKKSRGNLFTPAKDRTVNDPHHPATLDPYDSPSVFRRLFSPSTHRQTLPSPVPLKNSIGPTPQRDGKALGLFDLLSASGGSSATPSAKRMIMVGEDMIKTPSSRKRKRLDNIAEKDDDDDNDEDEDEKQMIRMGRTPASSSKKLYLERLFATPTTMRFATMVEDEDRQLPGALQGGHPTVAEETRSETNPLSSKTPSFLRRSNSGRYIPNANPSHGLSPVGVRKPQRFVGKGLSALVQGLRDMEEERMQDDWDVLKELETEQDPNGPEQNVQVGDSQAATNKIMDPPEGGRIWKKKAPKRTTRLVRMKPVIQSKPKTAAQATTKHAIINHPSNPAVSGQDQPGEDEEEEDLEDFIPDDSDDSDFAETTTRKPKAASSFSEKIKAMISDVKNKNPLANVTTKANNTSTTTAKSDNAKLIPAEKERKKRKVNPDAHANYRSLKIRSKGQGRFGKRFGRR